MMRRSIESLHDKIFLQRRGVSPLRRVLALAVALPLTIAGTCASHAADKLTMRLEWSAFVMHLPLYLAAEKGWFKAADLDMAIEDGNGSITAVQLVGNGQFDLGHAVISSMAVGASKGLPITSLTSYMKKSPLGIIYPKDSGIKTVKDLAGKKLIYTPASFESPFLEPFLKSNGLNPSALSLIGVDASAKITSYISGAGDAVVTTVPSDFPHINDKRPSDYLLFADHGLNLPGFGIIANTNALKQKGPAIKRFVSVVSAAWEYILDGHEQEAAEATMKQRPNAPTSVARLVAEYKMHLPYMKAAGDTSFPGIQSASDWQSAIKVMEAADVIKGGTKPEQYFTNDFIDPAYGRKIVTGK